MKNIKLNEITAFIQKLLYQLKQKNTSDNSKEKSHLQNSFLIAGYQAGILAFKTIQLAIIHDVLFVLIFPISHSWLAIIANPLCVILKLIIHLS